MAILLSIAKGFGFEEFLKKQTLSIFNEQQQVLSIAMKLSYAILTRIKSQAIVGVGSLFLFFSVFSLFENVEKSLNTIWNVKKSRGLVRRWINYLTAIVLFPIFFISSMSISIFINSELIKFASNYEFVKSISHYLIPILSLIPYGIMFFLFSYIYIFIPNTKVYWKSRFFAGIVATIVFQFWQLLYIDFQLYITSYNVIYGSFAALPLFLIWMQINFVIFFLGAELAAQLEGDRYFKLTAPFDRFETVSLKELTLVVLKYITANFLKGGRPVSIETISRDLGISLLDVREALNILEQGKMIAEISPSMRYLEHYQLIVNPELFSFSAMCALIEQNLCEKQSEIKMSESLKAVKHAFLTVEKAMGHVKMNLKEFALFHVSQR